MLRINGKESPAAGMTLSVYLERHGYARGRVAVERNGEIVPRRLYEETVLQDGDTVEIVSFVGGG